MGEYLAEGEFLSESPDTNRTADSSFSTFVSLASTIDGVKSWSVEADMQLVELLSKCAAKDGVTPQNLIMSSLVKAIGEIDSETSLLRNVNLDKAIARAALLRVANQVFSYALPYVNVNLPEEKLRNDSLGSDAKIEFQTTQLPPSSGDKQVAGSINNRVELGQSNLIEETLKSTHTAKWSPPCCARRLRSLRRLLFSQTKSAFFESILDATSTFTPMHQDDYEDPKEIKTIKINRVRATQGRLIALSNPQDRLKQSVFGQLHKELRAWPNSAFRRSYVGKGHGGQERADGRRDPEVCRLSLRRLLPRSLELRHGLRRGFCLGTGNSPARIRCQHTST
jgi:hypothetical protein